MRKEMQQKKSLSEKTVNFIGYIEKDCRKRGQRKK